MPRLPFITAQGTPGTLQLPRPGPAQFGGPGFGALAGTATQFGQIMLLIERNRQAQQDQLDVITKAGQYDQGLLEIREQILRDPKAILPGGDYRQQLVNRSEKLRAALEEEVSPGVQFALRQHEARALEQQTIELQAEGYKRIIGQQRADWLRESDRLIDLSLRAIDDTQAQEYRNQERALADGMLQRNMITSDEHLKQDESARNRYWEGIATRTPDRIIDIFARGETPADMDAQKLTHYMNLATGTLTAQQFRAERARKAEEAAIKKVQDANDRLLTAELLERKQVTHKLPELLRTRQIDPDKARTLQALEQTLATRPRTENLMPGLAAQFEAGLRRLKYEPGDVPEDLGDSLADFYIRGHITKEEFTHVMSIVGSVQDYKNQLGKEDVNQNVGRAHTNLVRRLRTTGPADKFDALSEQTIAEAEAFFYAHPDVETNPWAVMKEAETIFMPVLKERQSLSEKDTSKLDDAKMQALRRTGAISGAGYQAYLNRREEQKGFKIVEETLRNMPPPPEPGFFERLNPFGSKTVPEASAIPAPVQPRKRTR